MSHNFLRLQSLLLALTIGAVGIAPALAKSFELGVQEKNYLDNAPPLPLNGGTSYPAPQMIQQAPQYAAPAMMHASATQRPPIQATISKTLPPGFLGAWHVNGGRTKVEASPEFQGAAEQAFAGQTNNTWTINGSAQGGYSIGSDTGVNFPLYVDKVANGVAFVRYQHPVKNTMAQEAIVMQLGNGGATFSGLERISIIKQVEGQAPITRCKVQYQLMGQRQP